MQGHITLSALQERAKATVGRFARFRSVFVDNEFVDDPSRFDITHHVRELTPADLGGAPNRDTLRAYIENNFTAPFERSRPLWQFYMVQNYEFSATLLLARVHHVIVDGTAAVQILAAMSDEAATGNLIKMSEEDIKNKTRLVVERTESGCGPVGFGWGTARVLCKYVADLARPEPASPFRGLTGSLRSIAWAKVAADPSIDAARALGVTFNDVWMACLCTAMGDFVRMQTPQSSTAGLQLTAGLPVSLHPPILPPEVGDTIGNRFGFLVVRLPLEHSEPLARLRIVHETLMAAKSTPEAAVAYALTSCMGCVPASCVSGVLSRAGNARCSVIMSNVRGPPDEVHVNGLALGDLFGFLPTPPGVALGVGIGTYAGQAALSITCDRTLLGESADWFLQRMLQEHEAYCAIAQYAAAQRRPSSTTKLPTMDSSTA